MPFKSPDPCFIKNARAFRNSLNEEFGWRGVLTQVNGPAWPDAQPWDSMIFALLALAMVVFNRAHYFCRNAGSKEIFVNETSIRHLPTPQLERS